MAIDICLSVREAVDCSRDCGNWKGMPCLKMRDPSQQQLMFATRKFKPVDYQFLKKKSEIYLFFCEIC